MTERGILFTPEHEGKVRQMGKALCAVNIVGVLFFAYSAYGIEAALLALSAMGFIISVALELRDLIKVNR